MSIQWTIIAGYLYLEVAIVIIMIMPLFSPRRWNRFFKSRIFSMFQEHTAAYFYVLLGVLSLFLIDAIREMNKYSHNTEAGAHLVTEMKSSVKLFRAQRNFYITGFAIFLAFVIRRLVSMLIMQDELSKKAEMIIKQAIETVKEAKNKVVAHSHEGKAWCPEAAEWQAKLKITEEMLGHNREMAEQIEEELEKWKQKYFEARQKNECGVRG